ncbi:hypothetical protein PR202_gb19337 [Eleusine coracana subsp. coracana]|uniref:Uncharacterized protein n=1 Tax=Eleusine coracana subsp. coracana TaxID=191504 RepID=A0AAV5F804_ELECO|nr:hypothetical protein PR202_gb19337 [Eleusine coracana subsp. coracana]
MASGQDSSGTTLMDLITSDPSAAPTSGSVASSQQPSSGGGGGSVGSLLGKPTAAPADRKSKKTTLMQIQNETISAAKALNPVKALPQRNRKKKARTHPSRTHRPAISALFVVSPCGICSSCSPSRTRNWRGASTSLPRRAIRFVLLFLSYRIA